MRKLCDNTLMAENALAVSDFITDVLVFLLPIPMIMRLRMSGGRRLAVFVIFGVGLIALVASLIRMILYWHFTHLAVKAIIAEGVDNDIVITRGLYWSLIESGLAIIACCLPTLNALVNVTGSLESVVRSVRSMVSLRSYGSGRSSKNTKNFETLSGNGNSSKSAIVADHSNPASIHAYAMGDLSKENTSNSIREIPGPNGIYVHNKVEQTNSPV